MTAQDKRLNRDIKLNKKKSALKMLRNPKANKSLIAHKIGITRATLYSWINQKNQDVIDLKPEAKIKLWERQALKDLQGSEMVRDLMIKEVLESPQTISAATKNSIAASLSLSACQKWDKSRLEAGQGVSNDVHAILIGVFDRRQPQDVIYKVDNSAIEVVNGSSDKE